MLDSHSVQIPDVELFESEDNMTVQELIDILNGVQDKTKIICIYDMDSGIRTRLESYDVDTTPLKVVDINITVGRYIDD